MKTWWGSLKAQRLFPDLINWENNQKINENNDEFQFEMLSFTSSNNNSEIAFEYEMLFYNLYMVNMINIKKGI